MLTQQMGRLPPDSGVWAADNGCFARPWAFKWDEYARWLMRALEVAGPERFLFATTPDVWANGPATLERFDRYEDRMRDLSPVVALVVQDGMTAEALPWGRFDALFVGGSDAWRFGPEMTEIVRESKRLGLWSHLGRVNGLGRLKAARGLGFDSADGTVLAFGPDQNRPKVLGWLAELEQQPGFVL
jgi:hypothetical protein